MRVAAAVIAKRVEQAGADTMALLVAADADHLETKPGRAAAELAFQNARKQVSGEAFLIDRPELGVQLRLAQGGVEALLEVRAARPSLEGRVDRDHGVQIFPPQRSNRAALQGYGFHGSIPFMPTTVRRQVAA